MSHDNRTPVQKDKAAFAMTHKIIVDSVHVVRNSDSLLLVDNQNNNKPPTEYPASLNTDIDLSVGGSKSTGLFHV